MRLKRLARLGTPAPTIESTSQPTDAITPVSGSKPQTPQNSVAGPSKPPVRSIAVVPVKRTTPQYTHTPELKGTKPILPPQTTKPTSSYSEWVTQRVGAVLSVALDVSYPGNRAEISVPRLNLATGDYVG